MIQFPTMIQTELKRKSFHLFALIYVAGFYLIERPHYIYLLIGIMGIVLLIDYLRLKNAVVGHFFETNFNTLFRVEEKSNLSGVPWMTLGVLIVAVLVPPIQVASTIVLYLIFGDGVASLAGKSIGGPHWFRSSKRISGSVACFIACLLVGIFVLRPDYNWNGVWLGALVTAVFEIGFIPLNDNALLPLVGALTLKWFYNV